MNPNQDHPHDKPESELLSIEEAAELMTISPRHLRNLMRGKQIAYIKLGRSLRFTRSDLAAAIDRMRVESRA